MLVVAVAILGVLGAWAFWLEPASLELNEYRLEIPNWPQSLAGLRIAALADLHVGSPFNGLDKLERIVVLTNQSNPDLIVLLGDYVIQGVTGGDFVPPNESAPVLAKLQAPLGVWALLGNHDWWLDGEWVQDTLKHHGISVLENSSVPIQRGSEEFWLTGIGDLWEGHADIPQALKDVPDNAPTVAITHNPDIFPGVPSRVNLVLAGHTHGGQVRIPFFGPVIVPSAHWRRFAAGHIVDDGRHMFVSTGLGTSILSVRFLVPPEISLLVIEPEQSSERKRTPVLYQPQGREGGSAMGVPGTGRVLAERANVVSQPQS